LNNVKIRAIYEAFERTTSELFDARDFRLKVLERVILSRPATKARVVAIAEM